MAPSKITLFKDLSVLTQEYTLKVRIIRLWTRPMLNDATKVYSYDMIIMDETGAKMEATVLKKYCTSYQMLLQEKQCLLIYKPTMAENHYKYKVYPIPHKICFLEKTVVTSSPEPVASEYGFDFTNFQRVKDKKLAENTTIDIIGAVIKYYSMVKLEQPDGKLSKRLNLQLKDLEDKVLQVSASHLLDNNEQLSTVGNVPTEFNSIVEKKFAFKLHVAKYNLETNKEYYSISKLTTDLEIVSKLERKLEPLQESVSWTGDEVTPVSNIVKSKHFSSIDDEETPSSMFAGQDLKRNLHFVYDVEEGSSHSCTKPRISYKKR